MPPARPGLADGHPGTDGLDVPADWLGQPRRRRAGPERRLSHFGQGRCDGVVRGRPGTQCDVARPRFRITRQAAANAGRPPSRRFRISIYPIRICVEPAPGRKLSGSQESSRGPNETPCCYTRVANSRRKTLRVSTRGRVIELTSPRCCATLGVCANILDDDACEAAIRRRLGRNHLPTLNSSARRRKAASLRSAWKATSARTVFSQNSSRGLVPIFSSALRRFASAWVW